MPDIYVFPGGSVSADDRLAETTEGASMPVASGPSDPEGRTAPGTGTRAAAIRELFEEANVLLAYHGAGILAVNEQTVARFEDYRKAFNERKGSLVAMLRAEQLVLATERLVYCAHWITPEGLPKRFDTHFFLAEAPAEQEAIYDNLETSEGRWIGPAQALDDFARGTFPLVFATYHQLRDLTVFKSVQEALTVSATRYVHLHAPVLVAEEGEEPYVYLPEDATNPWKL
jgi:8-oxo-dGTP pyrophosphatase MutT (NUDIX family)